MKRKWVNQLEKLVKEYTEIPAFMTYVARHGWANFIVHPSVKLDDVIQLQPVVSNMPAVVLKQEEPKPPGNSSISPDDVDEIRKNLRSKFNIKGSD